MYICYKIDRVYFSRNSCFDVGILPASFPHPMSASGLHEVHTPFPDIGPVCPSSHMSPVVDPLCPPVVPFNPELFDTISQDCTDGKHPSGMSPGPNERTHCVATCGQVPSTELPASPLPLRSSHRSLMLTLQLVQHPLFYWSPIQFPVPVTLIDGSQSVLLRSLLSLLRRMWDVWNSTVLMLLRALLSTQRVSFPSCVDQMVTFICNPP